MAIQYHIDKAAKMVYVSFIGKVEDQTLVQNLAQIFADPDFEVGMDILCDYREVSQFEVSRLGMRGSAGLMTRIESAGVSWKMAVVAPQDVVYGMARMYQAFRAGSPEDVMVFRGILEARHWLGLPDNEEEK
ncbi:MAG: hypothetical protein JXA21_21845 [Anaerolineae bacterium]|nr:hypothetical protein [Anaerolineae bacterium]